MTLLSDLSDHPFGVLLLLYATGSLIALGDICLFPATFRDLASETADLLRIDHSSAMTATIVGWPLGWPLALTAQLVAWLHDRSRRGAA